MTDRELMQMALDAFEKIVDGCQNVKKANPMHESARDLATFVIVDCKAPIKSISARLAQPEPEPLWVRNEEGKLELQVPLHFLDPAKVARLIDEAFKRGKKEVDMEQVKNIAQKLADCALLNSAPPQREWQSLTDEEIRQVCWESGEDGMTGDREVAVRAAIAKLKEKNNAT